MLGELEMKNANTAKNTIFQVAKLNRKEKRGKIPRFFVFSKGEKRQLNCSAKTNEKRITKSGSLFRYTVSTVYKLRLFDKCWGVKENISIFI